MLTTEEQVLAHIQNQIQLIDKVCEGPSTWTFHQYDHHILSIVSNIYPEESLSLVEDVLVSSECIADIIYIKIHISSDNRVKVCITTDEDARDIWDNSHIINILSEHF